MTDHLHHMATLEWRGSLATGEARFDAGISDLALLPGPDGAMVYATTWRGGGIAAYELSAGEAVRLAGTRALTAGQAEGSWRGLALVEADGHTELVTGVRDDGRMTAIEAGGAVLRAPGALVTGMPAGGLQLWGPDTAVAQTAGGALFVSEAEGNALQALRPDGQGGFIPWTTLRDGGDTHLEEVTELATLELGGRSLLFAASRAERGISSFRVGEELRHADSSGPEEGLGLMSPTDMACVTLEGRGYVILASAPEEGTGGALTVWEVSPNGELTPTDHLLDSLETRFGQVQSLAVVPSGDRVYVLAGGGDDGITLFVLLPGGRLQLLDVMEEGTDTGLDSVQALAGVDLGGELRVLVAAQGEAGLGEIAVKLPEAGLQAEAPAGGGPLSGTSRADILVGAGGDDRLTGGAGADILLDGAGEDLLQGGAGADLFVLVGDGQGDRIEGFEAGQDHLDLSGWRFFHDPSALSIRMLSGEAEVTWRDEILLISPAAGERLSAEAIRDAVLRGADRPYRATPAELASWGPGTPHEEPAPGTPLQLTGSAGADRLRGGEGDDRLEGAGGADTLHGGAGDDSLLGGAGRDALAGETGADRLDGGAGDDRLFGGAGDDLLEGGDGADTLLGETGADRLLGGEGGDLLDGGSEDDALRGGEGDDSLLGGEGADELDGGAGNDNLAGGASDDILRGGEGDDRLLGGDGDDEIEGGAGADRAELGAGDDVFRGVVPGGTSPDSVDGGEGRDRIHGGAGDDLFRGGSGRDTIWGGAGDDLIVPGTGRDRIYMGPGADHLVDDPEEGHEGGDEIWTGTGDDRVEGGGGVDRVYGMGGDDHISGGIGADVIFGGPGADLLEGGPQADRLMAGPGEDRVYGGLGPDTVYLGTGSDIFFDTDQGGPLGADTVFAMIGHDTILGGKGNDVFHGNQGHDEIHGGAGDDEIYGGPGIDRIYAGTGDDLVMGGDGPDLVYLGLGADVFRDSPQGGEFGADVVHGLAGDDRLLAGGGDDRLFGGPGADELQGGAGNDRLDGGWGDDMLEGGAGADTFVFRSGAGRDRIRDFEPGQDLIHLEGLEPEAARLVDGSEGLSLVWDAEELLLEGLSSADLQPETLWG